jgi:hypothetical protein
MTQWFAIRSPWAGTVKAISAGSGFGEMIIELANMVTQIGVRVTFPSPQDRGLCWPGQVNPFAWLG